MELFIAFLALLVQRPRPCLSGDLPVHCCFKKSGVWSWGKNKMRGVITCTDNTLCENNAHHAIPPFPDFELGDADVDHALKQGSP